MKRIIASSVALLALAAFLVYQPASGESSKLTFTPAQPEAAAPAAPVASESPTPVASPTSAGLPAKEKKSPRVITTGPQEAKNLGGNDEDYEDEDYEDEDDEDDDHGYEEDDD